MLLLKPRAMMFVAELCALRLIIDASIHVVCMLYVSFLFLRQNSAKERTVVDTADKQRGNDCCGRTLQPISVFDAACASPLVIDRAS